VIHGAVRDATALMEMEIGIKALGTNPWRSDRNGFGSVDVPLRFGDAAFQPGQWVYSDEDGLLVATGELG
jgi:regulator of ribonuclease activity A